MENDCFLFCWAGKLLEGFKVELAMIRDNYDWHLEHFKFYGHHLLESFRFELLFLTEFTWDSQQRVVLRVVLPPRAASSSRCWNFIGKKLMKFSLASFTNAFLSPFLLSVIKFYDPSIKMIFSPSFTFDSIHSHSAKLPHSANSSTMECTERTVNTYLFGEISPLLLESRAKKAKTGKHFRPFIYGKWKRSRRLEKNGVNESFLNAPRWCEKRFKIFLLAMRAEGGRENININIKHATWEEKASERMKKVVSRWIFTHFQWHWEQNFSWKIIWCIFGSL